MKFSRYIWLAVYVNAIFALPHLLPFPLLLCFYSALTFLASASASLAFVDSSFSEHPKP